MALTPTMIARLVSRESMLPLTLLQNCWVETPMQGAFQQWGERQQHKEHARMNTAAACPSTRGGLCSPWEAVQPT